MVESNNGNGNNGSKEHSPAPCTLSPNPCNENVGHKSGNDFKAIYEMASKLFSDQALMTARPNVDLGDIELSKARAGSFLESMSNMRELRHEVDLMEADDLKFKHRDELVMLNGLREQCNVQVEAGNREIAYIRKRIQKVYDEAERLGVEPDMLAVEMLMAKLDASVSRTGAVVANADKLIKLERVSGGRRLGHRVGGSGGGLSVNLVNLMERKQNDVMHMMGLSDTGGQVEVRKLTMTDVNGDTDS